MKISHRLVALSAVSAAGLLCVAGVSYFAVTSIQSDLQGLTLRAAPLQARTLEMQERTERLMGSLLRLSLARTSGEATKATDVISGDLKVIDKLRSDIRTLDPKAELASADFRASQEQIVRAVAKRLADDGSYRSETESARAALSKAEQAVTTTRSAVNQIGTDAGKAADKAQDASRRLAQVTKLAQLAQTRLKDLALVVSDADMASNRFRLGPLKERAKATTDSIQRLEVEAGSEDHLKETRAVAAKLYDALTRDAGGLLALRANVLAKQADAEAAYQTQRKAVLAPIDEQSAKLGTLIDGIEVQAVKQRQTLEAALKLRNEPGGVVTTSEEVSLGIRDMVGSLRLLMLAATGKEAAETHELLRKQATQLMAHMTSMRAGLLKMNRPPLAAQVDAALLAMKAVATSIDKVAQTKASLLDSETQMAASMTQLKAVAARQTSVGEQQVKSVAERQTEVSAAVDRRVQSSLVTILGIAAGIIAVIVALSLHTVRIVTRRLDSAVRVAEAVSQGQLITVPIEAGNDETTRLMAALAAMVGTLNGIVGEIRSAADQIDVGTDEISRGNLDLSQRTEQQASQLQQTAASVEELSATVRQNADSALQAQSLASQASAVAGRGGELVGNVVSTMQGIQDASRRIAEIIGVIDGIAFQTNILALNAAVEAARAGEHGRGFAVVASEVRALAGKSAEAAQQIKGIVTSSVERVTAGSSLVQQTGSTMADIVQQVQRVSTLITEIARASEEQATSVSTVGSAVNHLDEMTQRNAALAEQSTAAAMTLREQAEGLTRAISVFRSGAELGEPAVAA